MTCKNVRKGGREGGREGGRVEKDEIEGRRRQGKDSNKE